jgi:DhnA family fructose-bisphosphate aldolase class Ia
MTDAPAGISRLRRGDGPILMVPFDHGASMGPIVDPRPVLAAIHDLATCVVVHKGLVRHVLPYADELGVLMHLSASTDRAPDPQDKRIVGSVEEAIARGAHGVSVHVNLGSRTEADQITAVGAVAAACHSYGVPLLAMVYPRGPAVKDPHDPQLIAHAARLGVELGADVVKVPLPHRAADIRAAVAGALGVPVVVAGGPRVDDAATLQRNVRAAHEAGAAGISVGRNVFEAADPRAALAALAEAFR